MITVLHIAYVENFMSKATTYLSVNYRIFCDMRVLWFVAHLATLYTRCLNYHRLHLLMI